MRAVVWHGIGDIRLDEVPEPTIQDPHDAIVRVTKSAICGTDLHFVRGTMAPMHHSVAPPLIDMVAAGQFDPTARITEHESSGSAIDAYAAFDRREPGWVKVELEAN